MLRQDCHQRWSTRTVFRYLLFQLPELGLFAAVMFTLQGHKLVSLSLAWSLIALWVVKDAVLYPFIWQAYEEKQSHDANPLIGATAIAQQRLDPIGYVRVQGELWRAELKQGCPPVNKDEKVRIRAIDGLTLSVEPAHEKDPAP